MNRINNYFGYISLIFVLFLLTPIISLGQETTIEAIVLEDDVNIMSSPNLESEITGSASLGNKVLIVSNNEEWYKIENTNGVTGWISNNYIIPIDIKNDPITKGIVKVDNLNLREQPDLQSNILLTLSKNTTVSIKTSIGDWHHVVLDNSQNGWVYSSYLEIIPNYSIGRVIGNDVNLRNSPTLEGKVLEKLMTNSGIYIKSYKDEWYEVITSEDKLGWIYKDYLHVKMKENNIPISRSVNRTSMKIIDSAKSLLGKPYVYGANGPSSFDCSGFTSYVFGKSGVRISRTSHSQSLEGTTISKNDLKMGDLVFFDTSGSINGDITHVGIYIENGNFIHASSGKNAKKVVISTLNEGYYKDRFVRGKRVF